ncbi:helix-turn-helix domain-containing protein [Ideonella sp.]|uniref:helix-turn-helix domain-containing protein n=1 Tax=Ideonella sp. TaxID=1929293 RepID=UPI003BB7076B
MSTLQARLPAAAPLPSLQIDLARISTRERRDFVHDLLAITWDISELDGPVDRLFWRSDVWMLDRIMIGTREVSPLSKQRDARRVRVDGMDHYQLMLATVGEIIADCGDHEVVIRPGELAIFDLGRPWRVRCTQTAHTSFVVPRACLPGLWGTLPIPHGTLIRGSAGALLVNHLQCLLHTLPTLGADQGALLAQATSHMLAACLDPTAENRARAAAPLRASLIGKVTQFIDARLADPTLSPEHIIGALGLSRSSLYRLLAPHGGVREFITDRRIAHASTQLRDFASSPRMLRIAESCGFGDAVSFSHAFKRKTGFSPSDYRASAVARVVPPRNASLTAPAQIQHWLATMGAS